MKTGEIVMIVILSILALTSWVIAYFQHKQRGFLFNNAYLYASKEERRRMNKTPYYKQSKVVFILVGFTFLTVALQIALVRSFWDYSDSDNYYACLCHCFLG